MRLTHKKPLSVVPFRMFTPVRSFGVFFVLLTGVFYLITRVSAPAHAVATTELNYQARILTSSGQVVNDGNTYSVAFNLYSVASGGTTQWTETHTGVKVVNGYISVRLGSVTAFPSSIDWTQEQWVTMNVNGDGEMNPRMKITAVPFAFRAKQADGITNGSGVLGASDLVQTSPLVIQTLNSSVSGIRINQTGAGGLVQFQNAGSDVFTIAGNGATTIGSTLTVSGADITVGTSSTQGTLKLQNGNGFKSTITATTLTADRTYTFPDASGAVCLDTGNCTPGGTLLLSGNTSGGLVTVGTNDNFGLALKTNSVEALRIDNLGNVGIGVTNPNEKLQVNGAINIGTTANTNAGTLRWTGSDFEGYDGTTWKSLTSSGSLRVNPTADVIKTVDEIQNSTVNTTAALQNDDQLTFAIGANETWSYHFVVQAISNAAPDLKFAVTAPAGATCKVGVADTEGAVSVANLACGVSSGLIAGNTTNDVYEVVGTVVNGATPGTITLQWAQNTANAANSIVRAGSYLHADRISGPGQTAQAFVQNGNSFSTTAVLGTTDNNAVAFISNGTEKMRLLSNGNFGIATNSPSALFSVGASSQFQVNGSGVVVASTSVSAPSFTGAGAVTLSSGGTGDLTLDSASNTLVIADNVLRRTDVGTTTLQLNDTANTQFSITNTDTTAVANLNVEGAVTATSFSGTFIGSGTSLTSLDAGNISTGTLNDLRLSSNVATLTGTQAFSGIKTFGAGATITAGQTFTFNGDDFTDLTGTGLVNTANALSVSYGSTAGTAVEGNTTATVTAGTGLSGGGAITLGAGGTVTLNVDYGSTANTAVQGNQTIICPSGSGNLTGGGNTLTLGAGGTCGAISTNNAVSFSTSVTAPNFTGAGAVTLSSGGTGDLTLDSANDKIVIASTDTTLQRTAAGAYTLDLIDTANTTFALTNSNSSGVLNLSADGTITAGSGLTVSAGGASITGAIVAPTTTDTINGIVINSGAISSVASITGTSTLAIASNGANTLTLDTGGLAAINLGTVQASTITIGRTGQLTTLNGNASVTGTINLNGNAVLGDTTTDRVTVTSQLLGATPLVFQGVTDNAITTTFAITDPTTISKTVTFPDASGVVCLDTQNCDGTGAGSGYALFKPGSAQVDSSANASINISKTNATGNMLTLSRSGAGSFSVLNSGALSILVDSAAALKVSNSAGTTNYFNVDSTGNIVQVGSATADATAIVFVLDSKTTAGDPVGASAVNGAQYYNQSQQQYRCYRDGAWETCGTNPIDRAWSLNDEFMSGYTGGACTTALSLVGNQNWSCFASGTATTAYNIGTILPSADHPGIIRLTTAAANGNGFTMALSGNNSGSVVVAANNRVTATAGQGTTITNNIMRIGLHSETTTNVRPLSGVWWEANASTNANWQYCYGNGTVATCTASSLAIVANTLYNLDIQVIATGAGVSAATFKINGTSFNVSAITIDTTNRVNPAISCFNSAAAARQCFVDYYQFSGVSATRR